MCVLQTLTPGSLEKQLRVQLAAADYVLDNIRVGQLAQYAELLVHWNRHINLTAIDDEAQIITHHLLDSLSVLDALSGTNILDMGTGGGLPGVPLAIACEHKSFTLLDARNKKIQFLNQVRAQLKLDNIHPLHQRAETYRPWPLFDTVVVRAFAPLEKIFGMASPLCAKNGRILAMKGRHPGQECAQLDHMGVNYKVKSLEVSGLNAERHLVILENGQASK